MSKLLKYVFGAALALALVIGVGAAKASAAAPAAPLTMGASGAAVMDLQNALIGLGYSIPAGATGYYGSQTAAAVSAFQNAYASEVLAPVGLTSGTGYYGTLTAAKLSALAAGGSTTPTTGATCPNGNLLSNNCMPAATTTEALCPNGMTLASNCTAAPSTTTGPSALTGLDGSISDVTNLSQYSNEEVGEGASDVKVLGFEVEASTDGDIEIKSVKLNFDATGNASGDSDKLNDYITGVKIWMGSTEVASADAEDFSEGDSGVFTKTLSVKAGTIVKSDSTEKFYVTVDGQSNLDSGDIDSDSWSVDVDNIRFVDGSGVITTEDSIGDIDTMNIGMDFVDFGDAADTELKISIDSASPEATVVMIDDEDTTDVVLLKGKMKLNGTSDVVLNDFFVTLTTTATLVSDATNNLTLNIGGSEYSETVTITTAATGTVTFDDLDFAIDAGQTVNFTVTAEVNDIESGALDEGDSLTASVTSTNVSNIDAENEEGDTLAGSELAGSATGEAQELRTQGIALKLVSTSSTSSNDTGANNDTGTFKITFNVIAVGEEAYMATTAATAVTYQLDLGGTATTATSATFVNDTDEDVTTGGTFLVEEADSFSDSNARTFTLTVTRTVASAGAVGQYRLSLTGVKWDDGDDTSPDYTYSSNLDTFKTSYVSLN